MREYLDKLAIFEGVFGLDSARIVPTLAWQATISSGILTSMLDEESAWEKIKCFAIAPYVGGGLNSHDIGNYSEVSVFTQAQRDTATGGSPDYATFLTHAFAAQQTMSVAVRTLWWNYANNLAQYCVSKGLVKTAIMPATYEHFWQHIVERNTSGGLTTDTRAAFVLMLRDARSGDAADYMHDWLQETGGIFCGFSHTHIATAAALAFGSWGYCNTIGDHSQQPYADTAQWVLDNP